MKVRYKCCMAPESRARYWSPQQECSRVVYENEPSPGPCFYCVITGGVYVEGREEVKARSGEEFCDHLCSLQVQTVTSGRCFTGNVGRGEAAVKCLLKSTWAHTAENTVWILSSYGKNKASLVRYYSWHSRIKSIYPSYCVVFFLLYTNGNVWFGFILNHWLVESTRNYVREPSGVFSVRH